MAIQLNESRIGKKEERALASGISIPLERGMLMVEVDEGGRQVVKPSTGAAATERVAGFLWLSETIQSSVPTQETVVVPSAPGPYTVALREAPLASTYRVTTLDGTPLTEGGGNDYTLSGNILTIVDNLTYAGATLIVTYRHAITAQELARRGGQRSVNMGAEGIHGAVTVCTGVNRIYVSNYDTSQAYAVGTALYTGANGVITSDSSTGTKFGEVFAAPTLLPSPGIEQLFLGVSCNLPLAP